VKSLLLLITLGLASTVCIEASPTYDFTITAPGGFDATGTITTTGASSPYTISSISGSITGYTANQGPSSGTTITGGSITGLGSYDAPDNEIPIDTHGFTFTVSNGDSYNIHLLFGSTYVLSDTLGNLDETSNAIVLSLTSVPETTTMALCGIGLLGIGAFLGRRRAANLR